LCIYFNFLPFPACFLRTYPGPEGTDIFTASRKRPGAISPQKVLEFFNYS
jgi:hypothetical protein